MGCAAHWWDAGAGCCLGRLIGSPFQIQGKSQSVFEPLHYSRRKSANLAFQTHTATGAVKFKLDQSLPVELASDLRGPGFDVDTVNDEAFGARQIRRL